MVYNIDSIIIDEIEGELKYCINVFCKLGEENEQSTIIYMDAKGE